MKTPTYLSLDMAGGSLILVPLGFVILLVAIIALIAAIKLIIDARNKK